MSEAESGRVVRQLRHDVDDVYELLSEVAETQRGHTAELTDVRRELTDVRRELTDVGQGFQQQGERLDRMDGRLGGIEDTQRQILDLLRGGRDGTAR